MAALFILRAVRMYAVVHLIDYIALLLNKYATYVLYRVSWYLIANDFSGYAFIRSLIIF